MRCSYLLLAVMEVGDFVTCQAWLAAAGHTHMAVSWGARRCQTSMCDQGMRHDALYVGP